MFLKSFWKNKKSLIFLFGGLLWGISVFLCFHFLDRYTDNYVMTLLHKYDQIEEISEVLEREYYDQAKLLSGRQQMIDSATKAFVDGLGDPFTSFLDAEEFSGLQYELEGQGEIEGIWAVVSKKDYYVQIDEIIKDSPAFKAWLTPLDRIVLIGTGEVKDLSITEAVQKIRGEKGTSVFLFIERVEKSGEKKYFEQEVIRDRIDIPSVRSKVLTRSGVQLWYIEVSVFGDETNRIFTREIGSLLHASVKWIILDLRGNGWGLLESAVELAGHFIPQGEIVVKTEYLNFEPLDYPSKGFWELEKMPIVVLIDEMSASASEILALALKDYNKALILGQKSFWKWSIQTLYEFKDGSSLKYTVGSWFSPTGKGINGEWIEPDVVSVFDLTGYVEYQVDSQLQDAENELIKLIQNK